MNIDSLPKSASSSRNLVEGPDFASWQTTNLVNFAHDAYVKLREQDDQLQQMRQDLKTAMEAYRSLLRQK